MLKALRDGDFFVTTGEILIPSYSVEGTGDQRTLSADVEWTFPLSFVEVVWGDGKKIDRQVIPATDLPAVGDEAFLPFRSTPKGKAWVRFARVGLGRERSVRSTRLDRKRQRVLLGSAGFYKVLRGSFGVLLGSDEVRKETEDERVR